jgi:hypothetical protein
VPQNRFTSNTCCIGIAPIAGRGTVDEQQPMGSNLASTKFQNGIKSAQQLSAVVGVVLTTMAASKTMSRAEKDQMVANASKSGVPYVLDLMDKWRADEAVISVALSKLLSSPFDQVQRLARHSPVFSMCRQQHLYMSGPAEV